MLPEIIDLANRRKSLGLKQKELAKASGVSQSFIAKLESGKINPSYDRVKAIVEVLERKEHEKQPSAKQIMQKRIISVDGNDMVSNAIVLMKKYGISQLPVIQKEIAVGSISDRTILDMISDKGDIKDVSEMVVAEVMDNSFPTVPEDTPISTVRLLLKHNLSVLVTHKGRLVGIISKADVINIKR
ncbi:MAG: CBS domain-containing protein [Candidatus Aenigmatarchaeota archaeon]|nr:CBS domain-containing protein [Nanoarchaeota archaeon]